MKVVLDTNVLVSGIFFHGIPGQITDAWIDGKFDLYITPTILEEYARVILELSQGPDDFIAIEWMTNLTELCRIIPEPMQRQSYSRDAHDDKFIDCAIRSKADYLVTGDKDLTVLQDQVPIQIVSPRKFVSLVK